MDKAIRCVVVRASLESTDGITDASHVSSGCRIECLLLRPARAANWHSLRPLHSSRTGLPHLRLLSGALTVSAHEEKRRY